MLFNELLKLFFEFVGASVRLAAKLFDGSLNLAKVFLSHAASTESLRFPLGRGKHALLVFQGILANSSLVASIPAKLSVLYLNLCARGT